jgi:hypothetical protein
MHIPDFRRAPRGKTFLPDTSLMHLESEPGRRLPATEALRTIFGTEKDN